MESRSGNYDLLYEQIRKELNSILESESKTPLVTEPSEPKPKEVIKTEIDNKVNKTEVSTPKPTNRKLLNSSTKKGKNNEKELKLSKKENKTAAKSSSKTSTITDDTSSPRETEKYNINVSPEEIHGLTISKLAESFAFLDNTASHSMDKDLKKMQIELDKSYELFQTISYKLENISFSNLKTRIKNLNLYAKSKEPGTDAHELKKMFDKSYIDNQIQKLTSELGTTFQSHPGEFADIPEVSEFFTACTQLERGLNQLKKQREQTTKIEKRLFWGTELSMDRITEIRNAVSEETKP